MVKNLSLKAKDTALRNLAGRLEDQDCSLLDCNLLWMRTEQATKLTIRPIKVW